LAFTYHLACGEKFDVHSSESENLGSEFSDEFVEFFLTQSKPSVSACPFFGFSVHGAIR
jgi:hypothetical protein